MAGVFESMDVDLDSRGAIEIQDLEADTGGSQEDIVQSAQAEMVDFSAHGKDAVVAVLIDV